MLLDQFIYTTAKTDSKTGYQVVAKSNGINDTMLHKMDNYLYPLGVSPEKFTVSKALLSLGKHHAAYSIVKNIGVGYDGRNDNLYNHTMIFEKEAFMKIGNDTRVLDKYFIEEYNIRGPLPTLDIYREDIEPDFKYLQTFSTEFLRVSLFYLFQKQSKIAIVGVMDTKLIQNLLVILAEYIRFIPFSTLVLDATRQTQYNIIQVPQNQQSTLPTNYKVINDKMLTSFKFKNKTSGESIKKIVDMIQEK